MSRIPVHLSETLTAAAIVPPVNAAPPGIGDAARAGSGFPVAVLAVAVLAAEQVSGVLVGSVALWLRGESVSVGDVDVVIEPGEVNLRRLHEALCWPGGAARGRAGGAPAAGDLGCVGFLGLWPGGLHAGTRPS